MSNWSWSRLYTYLQCPERYRLAYVDEVTPMNPPAFERGSRLHEFWELYGRHCYGQRLNTDLDWVRDYAKAQDDDKLADAMLTSGEFLTFDPDLLVTEGSAIEREFEENLTDEIVIGGRIDRLEWNEADGTLWLTDYKSHYRAPSKPENCPPQLRLYAWAMCQQFKPWQVVCLQSYPVAGVVHDWTLTPPDADWIVQLVKRIDADTEYEACPSPNRCMYCPYIHACSIGLDNRDEPERLATRMVWAEAAYKRLHAVLKEHTAEHGTVYLPTGEALGWRKQEGNGYGYSGNARSADGVRRMAEHVRRAADRLDDYGLVKLCGITSASVRKALGEYYEGLQRVGETVEFGGQQVEATVFVADKALDEDWWRDMIVPTEAKDTFGLWEATTNAQDNKD